MSSARLIAIANGAYRELVALERAVPDAQALADVLEERGFAPLLLADLEAGPLTTAVAQHLPRADSHDGVLILSWTGHGLVDANNELRLQGTSGGFDVDVARASDLGEWAARTGARRVLVLIDTCFAGRGVIDAARVASAVSAGRRDPGSAWFAVIAASLGDEPARSGALSRVMQRLLSVGPTKGNKDVAGWWVANRPYIRGNDLLETLLNEWDEPRQTPTRFLGGGLDGDFVRNPLFKPDLPDQPVEDLLHALRAGEGAGDQRFFTGREAALERLVGWLALAKPGLFVVTGPPGCGKSALVGRLADLSAPAERARLLQSEAVPAALDPGEGSIQAQIQARGATVDSAAEELARQLGVDPATGSFGVLGAARKRRLAGRPLAVVVDGLDEALQMSQPLVDELLLPLAREARVIVATRDLPLENSSLVAILGGPEERIDLGEDPGGTLRDVRRYVLRRLAGVDPKMDPERVADEIARGEAAPAAAAPFLLARLLTSQLRDQPVDTDSQDWRLRLAGTVESALERDLGGVVIEIDGRPHPGAARELLRALAAAHGSGFPADDVWPAVATALSPSGTVYGRDAAYAALGALGRHVIASSEGGQPVYRLAHRQLSDYLARLPQGTAERSEEVLVAQAIDEVYEQWLDEGHAPQRHTYLWRFAWRHFADAGAPGLQHLERLVERDRDAFLPDLAAANDLAGAIAGTEVRIEEALHCHEQAVKVRRELGDPRRLTLSLFQLSLARSMVGDEQGADSAADEATELARSLRDEPQGRSTLASALLTKAVALVRDGRYETARRLADEAIALDLPYPEDEDDEAWVRRVTARTTASRAAQLSGDVAEGERHARVALDIADAHDALTNSPLMFLEVCSTLAYLLAQQAAMARPGPLDAFDTEPGQRVLDEFRRSGRRGDLGDLMTAKALVALARLHGVNASRGLASAQAIAEVPELIDLALDLTRANASTVVDYGILFADAAMLRAALVAAGGAVDAAAQELKEPIAALRCLPADNLIVGMTLGQVLDAATAYRLNDLLTGTLQDLPQTTELQQEAVTLLRRGSGGGQAQRLVLASALGRLAALLMASGNERDTDIREEAIGVLRELDTDTPAIGLMLLGNLVDQAGRLLGQRTGESAECSREVLRLAATLPDVPQVRLSVAAARINLANAQLQFGGEPGDIGDLFRSAITALDDAPAHPALIAGLLANAHAGLAQILVNAGEFAEGLVHAREGARLIELAMQTPFTEATRWATRVALGRALRGTGAAEEGLQILREVLQTLCDAALASDANIGPLAAALNTGGADLWDDTLAALNEHPKLQRRIALMRNRPADEIGLTVQTVLEALGQVEPAELRIVRDAARSHRQIDPANFDRAWREQGAELPDWLLVPEAVEWAVIGWWNVPTWVLSREYLRTHPLLLDPLADIVLEEFADSPERREVIDLHLRLLADARRDGVDAAYAPMMLNIEVSEWLRSEAPQEYLARHPELQRPEVQEKLRAYSAEGDARATAFAAILELTRRGEQDLAFQALQKPDTMSGRLRAAWRDTDAPRLEALATIVGLASGDETDALQAALAVMVAQVLQQREPVMMPALRERLPVQDDAMRAGLTELVNDAIEHHRSAEAQLSALLALLW
ncbi:AAA family ATPase [Paucibacter sp. R3-3]|uniref:AAA family ATPase n=1 Tax=Roseateles agri TaxID=3098619 RepID=A0ABU5DAK3_9BURK|nr:AAA family ATPase [Paucibacter sp. R3-3]MDY0743312.1 AAA family ATPase [Paucibacter sp. R3-3]